jgi:hypothetical protein
VSNSNRMTFKGVVTDIYNIRPVSRTITELTNAHSVLYKVLSETW